MNIPQILSLLTPHFPVTSNPPLPLFFLLFYFFGWMGDHTTHIWCVTLLTDNMDLHMWSLGTIIPEGPWNVFYANRHQVNWGLTRNVVFTGTLIWYHTHKKTQTHTAHSGTSRLTQPYITYIYTTCYVLTTATFMIKWIHWYQNLLFPCCFFSKIIQLQN